MRILPARSHPYLGRPPNNSPPLLAATSAYLDLSNSSSNSSNRIRKVNKVLREHLETNRRSDRRTQHNLNRVDVSCHLQPSVLASSVNMKQYLAILRLNSLLRGCLVTREVVCSEIRSNRVLNSKAANHPHSVCLETRQPHLHQWVADFLVIMPPARRRRQVYPNNLVFLAIRSDSQLLSPRITPSGEAVAFLGAHLHPPSVQSRLLRNPSEALH